MGCFSSEPPSGDFPNRLSSIKEAAKWWSNDHVVCFEDVWPKESVQACLASAGDANSSNRTTTSCRALLDSDSDTDSDTDSDPVSGSDSDSENVNLADNASQSTFRRRLTCLGDKLRSTRNRMRCLNCAVVVAPGEAGEW